MAGEDLDAHTKEASLDAPIIYGPWIMEVLRRRDAGGSEVPEMKAMLSDFERYSDSRIALDLGIAPEIKDVIEKLRQQIDLYTKETVEELNLALVRYKGRIPETYVILGGQQPEPRVVEGFSQGDNFSILPVVNGEVCHGEVVRVEQIGDEQ